jgi:hypothetical protein
MSRLTETMTKCVALADDVCSSADAGSVFRDAYTFVAVHRMAAVIWLQFLKAKRAQSGRKTK